MKLPGVAPVAVTLNAHWLFPATVAPVSAMLRGAVIVKVPPQGVVEELAVVNPTGRASVKATREKAVVLELVMVKVSDVFAESAILVGLKALAIEGGAITTESTSASAEPKAPP